MITRLPGEPLVAQAEPLLPFDHVPKMPAAAHASTTSSMNGSFDGTLVPHELLTTCGRLVGTAHAVLGLKRLRLKLAQLDDPVSIASIRGVGFRLSASGAGSRPAALERHTSAWRWTATAR